MPGDEKAAADWLVSQGLVITRRDENHLAIFVRGTIAQIAKALNVNFGRVSYEGNTVSSAISSPSLPASFSSAVVGVNGLQPYLRPHKHLTVKTNSLTGTNQPFLPSQIAKAESASPLYSSNITGAGQSIAIVIDTFPSTSDLVSFWKTYSVKQSLSNIQFIQVSAESTNFRHRGAKQPRLYFDCLERAGIASISVHHQYRPLILRSDMKTRASKPRSASLVSGRTSLRAERDHHS